MTFFINMIIATAISFIASLLLAKKPPSKQARKMDNPESSQGNVIPIVFGEVTIKNPNVLWYGDKRSRDREI